MPSIKITIKDPEKNYFPGSTITKLQLIEYYRKIAPVMLKYCRNRPINMERYPGDGRNKRLFFQKNIPAYFPNWVKRVRVLNKSTGAKQKSTTYVLCQDRASLVYLANQACITPHIWLSTIKNLTKPNLLIFDLDPGVKLKSKIDFKSVKLAALALKELLETKYGLTAFLMTTGSRGLHIRVPIKPTLGFDQVRIFAKLIALQVVNKYPALMTLEARQVKRKNRLLIDIMRNSYGATAVAPYAVRARANAPIATPLEWHELDNKNLNAQKYNLKNIFRRIKDKGDLWQNMSKSARSLKNL